MPYLSLYRKYRPQTFAQVMGQDHVVQTLQNALRYGHVANGYLFCGTRGVAKTTIARILAKCLNCVGADGSLTSPQPEPCNRCEPCLSIQGGHNVDVVEMDAASNRSVTDIAKLRESVQFGPMETRFKVYIVDEAHQLSSDAKDAFLKTLEEPPANVVFILATTESHAIPITIASRCQQFDFRRGSVQQIAEQCRRVLVAERVEMPDDALALVARAAEGSYRDALSLLDQVLAYKRDGITESDVAAALGTVEGETIDAVLAAVAAGDQAALFGLADQVFLQGKDVRHFLRALAARLRDLLFVRSGASAEGLLESGADAAALKKLAQTFPAGGLVPMIETVSEAERQLRFSDQHRLLLEMTLLKLAAPTPVAAIAATAPAASEPTRPIRKAAAEIEPTRRSEPAPLAEASVAANGHAPAAPRTEPERREESLSPPLDDAGVLRRLQSAWQEVLRHVQVRSASGMAKMQDSYPIAVQGTMISLEFPNQAKLSMFDKPKSREFVEAIINEKILRGAVSPYRLRAVLASASSARQSESVKAPAAPERQHEQKAFVEDSDEPTPVLDAVIAEFGGRIIED